MKKNNLILLVLIVMINFTSAMKVYAVDSTFEVEKPKLQIPVMSDVHIKYENDKERFVRALQDYKKIAPNYKAIALVGDITDSGSVQEYKDFMGLLNNYGKMDAEKIITMGNHEYKDIWYNPIAPDKVYLDRFANETGMPNVYYDKWVEGYHFITLGGEVLNESNGNGAILSQQQYDWLEKTLPVNADSKKPIFVFLHQAIDSTVYGSEFWNGNLSDGKLFNILKKYPQVIFFSGHSHNLVDHPRTVYQNGFTMVNTGSTSYTWFDGGPGPYSFSQGLLVNVYDDRVEIKSREFSNGSWLRSFTIKTPFEKTIYDDEKPRFKLNSKINISDVNYNSAKLSLTSATDNTQVDAYVIKQGQEVLKTDYIKYWEKDEDNIFETTLNNLTPDTNYNLEVYAKDAWGNESEVPLKIGFKTSKLSGWVDVNNDKYYYDPVTGVKKTGWFLDNNSWYYLDSDGKMETDWILDGGKWYFLNKDGKMKTGWLFNNNKWYYLSDSGDMETGWLYNGGKWYYLNNNGDMKTGWFLDGSTWYYLNDSGDMKTGWLFYDNHWYYLNKSGDMKTGWLNDGGNWYYLNNSGSMHTGWFQQGSRWYFFKASGEMATGWVKDNDKWYYLNQSGVYVA